jgi:tRNA threonylcarbamoyladenosine biosynthesis protein TsaE
VTDPLPEVVTASADQTVAIGAALAGWLRDGDVVLLHGDLGSGKTTLAKGIATALGVKAIVASPSFGLVNEYDAGLPGVVTRLYHLDLYRLESEDDLASIGFAEFIHPVDGVTLVEWPERAVDSLPERYLLVELDFVGPERRRLRAALVPDDGWGSRHDALRTLLKSLLGHTKSG